MIMLKGSGEENLTKNYRKKWKWLHYKFHKKAKDSINRSQIAKK